MQGYGGSDDWIVMPLQCVTQWDSLAHVFYEGKMYNGYDAALVTSSGTSKNSIDKTKRQHRRPRRPARRRALEGRARASSRATRSRLPIWTPPPPRRSVEVRRGDLLLDPHRATCRAISTGSDWRNYDLDDSPGVSVHAAPWMHAKEIAAVAADNYAVEVRPSQLPAVPEPVPHLRHPEHGADARRDLLSRGAGRGLRRRRTLRLPPRRLAAARHARVGTPINPYAIK